MSSMFLLSRYKVLNHVLGSRRKKNLPFRFFGVSDLYVFNLQMNNILIHPVYTISLDCIIIAHHTIH